MANPSILIAGLQGTGKTLVAGTFSSLSYSLGSRQQGELSSFVSRHICSVLRPGVYPYTVPVDGKAPAVDIRELVDKAGIALPQVMVSGYVAAVPSIMEYFRPDLLVICHRSLARWEQQVTRTDSRAAVGELGAAWQSVELLRRYPHLTFDVDVKRFGKYVAGVPLVMPGDLTLLTLQKALLAILRIDSRAYGG